MTNSEDGIIVYTYIYLVDDLEFDFVSCDVDLDDSSDGKVEGDVDGNTDDKPDGELDSELDSDVDGAFDGTFDGVLDGNVDGTVDGKGEGATLLQIAPVQKPSAFNASAFQDVKSWLKADAPFNMSLNDVADKTFHPLMS